MSCAILTPEGIYRLLLGTLSAEEQPTLLEHLSSPCEECLDLLAGPAGEAMLERLAGDGLTQAESDRIFAAAVAPPARRRSRWMTPNIIGAAIAASVALIGIWGSIQRSPPELDPAAEPPYPAATWLAPLPSAQAEPDATFSSANDAQLTNMRRKGADTEHPSATLIALAGRPGSKSSVHLLLPKQHLARGEVLLLRMRISASFAYLLSFADEGPARLFWPAPAELSQLRAAGEYELTGGGAALSIDVRALGRAPVLALIASPQPLDLHRLERLPRDVNEIAGVLPGCGIDVLQPRADP